MLWCGAFRALAKGVSGFGVGCSGFGTNIIKLKAWPLGAPFF